MPRPAKPTNHLDNVRHLMGTMPDQEVATLAGDTAAAVGNYRRKYAIPAYEGYKFTKSQPPARTGRRRLVRPERPAPATPPTSAPRTPRGRTSKLNTHKDQIGKQPDAVIAQQAGVTVAAVRQYRRKHNIVLEEGADQRRNRGSEAIPDARTAKRTAPTAEIAEAEERTTTRKPRRSKLDPFRDQVGQLPDSEIAAMAGISIAAVYQYRSKNAIPAAWANQTRRGRPTRQPAEVGTEGAPRRTSVQQGYTMTVGTGDATCEYILLAPDLVTATRQAASALSAGELTGEILAIRHLGPALA